MRVNPDFARFKQVADRALQTGGALGLNRRGEFVVKGAHWASRKILWLKARIMPNRVREENHLLLNALALSLSAQGAPRSMLAQKLPGLQTDIGQMRDPFAFTRHLCEAAGQAEAALHRRAQGEQEKARALALPEAKSLQHEATHQKGRRRPTPLRTHH